MNIQKQFQVPVLQTNYAKILVEVCTEYGLDLHQILEQSGLPADLMQTDSEFIPAESLQRLMFLISTQLGVSNFRDLLKLAISQRILPIVLHQFSTYSSIGEAFDNINQIYLSDTPSSNVFIKHEYGQVWFCTNSASNKSHYVEWSEAFAIVYITELMAKLTGKPWHPTMVKLHSNNGSVVKEMLPKGCQLSIGNEHFSLLIPKLFLELPLHISKEDLSAKPHVVEWHTSFTDNVFEVLKPYVRERVLTVEFAAELLDYSLRTFQRKLSNENISFRKIRENLVFSVACELIEEGHSLTYISSQLGYANLAHFSRAFKRVSGLTPKMYKATVKPLESEMINEESPNAI